MDMAAGAGLQYLADAEQNYLVQEEWAPAFQEAPPDEDLIRREQRSDFLRQRVFRKSLLCHAELPLDPGGMFEKIRDMWVISFLKHDPAPGSGGPPGTQRFLRMDGKCAFFIGQPALKLMLTDLQSRFPRAVRVRDLMASLKVPPRPEDERNFLGQLVQLWKQGCLDLLLAEVDVPSAVGGHPRVSPVARFQSAHSERLTNQLHGSVNVTDSFRRLIPFIDGSRSIQELVQVALDEGVIAGDPRLTPTQQLAQARLLVERFLEWCRQHALLVA
jgi:hypothetical protein